MANEANVKDIEKLKGLNPIERIKKLKEIEEEIKKELESVKELDKQTEKEIEEEKKRKLLEMVPEREEVRIEDLFKTEENLEGQVKKEYKEEDADNKGQPPYLMQKLDNNKAVIGNMLNKTYSIKEFVDRTVSKYNPNLGERLNKELFTLANELKSLYEHKINE